MTARMRGDVLARAELQKGEVLGEVINQVGAYAKMRYQAAEETKLNEALLEAEEGIRQASYELSKSPKIYNVLDGDDPLWDQETSGLRDQILDKLGTNRFTREKFTSRFDQLELSTRFQLRNVVDKKIVAAEQAAAARRKEATVLSLSDAGIGDPQASIDLYAKLLGGHEIDDSRAVSQGRANPTLVQAGNLAMKKAIAANVVSSYASSDPMLALNLLGALEIQEALDAGIDVGVDEMPDMGDAAYALFTLQQLPKDDALEVIDKTLKVAERFASAADKIEKREEQAQSEIIESATNRYFYYEPDEEYGLSDLEKFIPGVSSYLDVIPETGRVSGEQARQAIVNYLDTYNAITPETRKKFEDTEEEVTAPYREVSVQKDYDVLFALRQSGDLIEKDVINLKSSLSRADFVYFMNEVTSRKEKAVKDAEDFAKSTFQYDEQVALDPEMARASKAAYYAVVRELNAEVTRRSLSEQGPMTPREINKLTQSLINDQQDFFKQQLRQDYIGTIDRYNQLYSGVNLDLGLIDPIGDLDAWYEGLEDQTAQQRNYARIKETLKREYFDKGFQY
jgi:hypothetical protein